MRGARWERDEGLGMRLLFITVIIFVIITIITRDDRHTK